MSAITPDDTKKDAPPAPPAPPADKPAEDKPAAEGSGSMYWFYGVGISSIVFIILFHFGAAYLSYQKYGSILWSILDFFFAGFYYPFYAFFLAKDPGPSMGMVGGRRRKY